MRVGKSIVEEKKLAMRTARNILYYWASEGNVEALALYNRLSLVDAGYVSDISLDGDLIAFAKKNTPPKKSKNSYPESKPKSLSSMEIQDRINAIDHNLCFPEMEGETDDYDDLWHHDSIGYDVRSCMWSRQDYIISSVRKGRKSKKVSHIYQSVNTVWCNGICEKCSKNKNNKKEINNKTYSEKQIDENYNQSVIEEKIMYDRHSRFNRAYQRYIVNENVVYNKIEKYISLIDEFEKIF